MDITKKILLLTTRCLVLILVSSALCLAGDHSSGPTLFRYVNEQGSTVISYILPPEYIGKGYFIVNAKGDILKTIPAALSKEERINLLEEERSAGEQANYDKLLLLKYNTLAELRRAQKRKLEELDSKLSVLRGNLSNIKNQIENEQYKAANFERQGRQLPEVILMNLDELYGNLEKTETLLKRREIEVNAERKKFSYEMHRFKQLKGLI